MKQPLTLILANPRGFCAGVDRAIKIVEHALIRYGAPVYVRHEIVHNAHVVKSLQKKGAIFVEELSDITDKDAPVIFSAHGVPKTVPQEADRRNMFWLDATCPLVSKVHRAAEQHYQAGRYILLIGHAGHPEVIGTMGQVAPHAISLIETVHDAENFMPPEDMALAYVTQTTLSVDDTAAIIACLKQRFPKIYEPHKQDICYATTNRQEAVKALAAQVDMLFVVGAPNSSNAQRLVEVGKRAGCKESVLITDAHDLDYHHIGTYQTIGITAGASAPEIIVEEIIAALQIKYDVTISDLTTAEENIVFKLPKALRE